MWKKGTSRKRIIEEGSVKKGDVTKGSRMKETSSKGAG